MTPKQIEQLSEEEVLALMRREGLKISHSMFATIHQRSPSRPDGFTEGDLDEISERLESGDLTRWRRELVAHFASGSVAE